MSLDKEQIAEVLGKLIAWLETWRTSQGAYLGFVVHRFEQKRMGDLHDTAWTQAAMIRGYANLYRKSGEERWRERLQLAADLQTRRYDPSTGKVDYAGHEDDRFCSLVHCALAGCALLEAATLLDEARAQRYLEEVAGNVDRYWFPKLWVEEEGAFRFSEIDHYSPDEDRFVLNFNCIAAECLLLLAERSGESRYRETAHRIGEWLLAGHKRAREVYAGWTPCDDPMEAPPGGLPYQYTSTQFAPDDCVTIYAGLSLRGIVALYRSMAREELRELGVQTAKTLLAMRDPKTRLFYHTTRGHKIERFPQFVAGAGMTLSGLLQTEPWIGPQARAEESLQAILDRGYPNGSFPNFIGKDANRPGGNPTNPRKVWEDAAAGPNWNAQLFEYLTLLVDDPRSILEPPSTGSVRQWTPRYYYSDTFTSTTILSWRPPRSWGIYKYSKRRPQPIWAMDPRVLRSKIRTRERA